MLRSLRRIVQLGTALRELRALRQATERIADALEYANAQQWGQTVQANPDVPAVEISYVNDDEAARIMDAELRLTTALGRPPTEEEIFAEVDRQAGAAEAV